MSEPTRPHREGRGHGHGHSDGGHSHDVSGAADIIRAGSAEGIRALKFGAVGLLVTAAIQFGVYAVGSSAALFADALHNTGDVLTTIALWIAFVATRRAADRRYTFGYQRMEDIAGVFIVLAIVGSGVLALYEGATSLASGSEPTHLFAGILAGGIGVVGNEVVAQIKIRAGRRIDSPALVAEGQHSRVDGLASLAAVIGLGGVWLGAGWADPVAGIAIGAVILYVGYDAGRPVLARLADRVDEALIERIARIAVGVDEVQGVHDIRARWAGRALYVLVHVDLPASFTLDRAHAVSEDVRHRVVHELPEVVQMDIHLDPVGGSGHHDATAHHFDAKGEP